MAWSTTLVFEGDELIGQDARVVTEGVTFFTDFERAAKVAKSFVRYTVVTVSAHEFFMEPRRYTKIATDHYLVNREAGVGWFVRPAGPILSEVQRRVVREWLIGRSRRAWEKAAPEVKAVLEGQDAGTP